MAHLFKQMLVDKIDFQNVTPQEVIDLIFTDHLQRQIQMLIDLQQSTRETDLLLNEDTKDMLSCKEKAWLYSEDAKTMIDRQDLWHSIIEAFKILKYPEPTAESKLYIEQLYDLPWHVLNTIYLESKRTVSFMYLMDYVNCVCKLKYEM